MKFKWSLFREKGVSPQHGSLDSYHAAYWEMPRLREWPIYPFCVEEVRRSAPTWYSERNCGFMMLVMILDGHVNYACGDSEFSLSAGKMLLVPLASTYAFESETCGGHYHKIVVEVKGAHLASIAESLGLDKPVLLDTPGSGFVARCKALGALMGRREESDMPELLGELLKLLTEVSLLIQSPCESTRLLSSAQARLESRLGEILSTPVLASELGTSCATLNRLFRARLKVSPQKYRLLRKIEKARELLENTSLSIKEIAERTGYCNQFYFASEFKRLTGCAPSVYRDRL